VTIQEIIANLENDDVRHIVSLSGGKDSTAMALYMKENYPEIPAEYIFCDTGAELPETYDYLSRLEALLGKEIVRLSALSLLKIRPKPGRSAFDVWLQEVYGGFLPNPRARWCTRVLKIKPFEHYIGNDRAYSYIGIRWDENREGYQSKKPPVLSEQPNIIPVYPFKDDEMGFDDIQGILEDSGLGFPDYYRWRSTITGGGLDPDVSSVFTSKSASGRASVRTILSFLKNPKPMKKKKTESNTHGLMVALLPISKKLQSVTRF